MLLIQHEKQLISLRFFGAAGMIKANSIAGAGCAVQPLHSVSLPRWWVKSCIHVSSELLAGLTWLFMKHRHCEEVWTLFPYIF